NPPHAAARLDSQPSQAGLRGAARHLVPRRAHRSLLGRARCAAHETTRLFRARLRVPAAPRAPLGDARPHAAAVAAARLRAVAPPLTRYGRGGGGGWPTGGGAYT